jgi:hypothetical protein
MSNVYFTLGNETTTEDNKFVGLDNNEAEYF